MKKPDEDKKKKSGADPSGQVQVAPAAGASSNLRALFLECLKDIYWAENTLLKALPKMAANATDPGLKSCIKDHHDVTQNQALRLEKAFELLGEKAEGKKCEAMAGLLAEGNGILEETEPGPVRDAGIIAASQKVEHYEIASYGTLFSFAKALGENDVAKLLQQTLAEEMEADKVLTDVAIGSVNGDASELPQATKRKSR